MPEFDVPKVEKFVTDIVGILTASIGVLGLAESLLDLSFISGSLPLFMGTMLSLTVIGFGVILTTHGATKALKQLRKTIEDVKS